MKVTLGVPLNKQIINTSKIIDTPIITCMLVTQNHEPAATIVKGRIEKTYLEAISLPPSLHSYKITRPHPPLANPHKITPCMEDSCSRDNNYVSMHLDQETISKLQLELPIDGIINPVVKCKPIPTLQDNSVTRTRIRIYNARDGREAQEAQKRRFGSLPTRVESEAGATAHGDEGIAEPSDGGR